MGKKEKVTLILLLILLVLIGVAVFFAVQKFRSNDREVTNGDVDNNVISDDNGAKVVELNSKNDVKIFNGDERPIAVMIDNHSGAWPQAGLNQAYLVYEIVVEGGETRLMALFKSQDVKMIGPIRSSRHYFLDYALENDAIYVHYGWSPQAQSDISTLKVNNINGINESSSSFWRSNEKSSPHNVVTTTAKIKEIAANKGYNLKSTKKSVLNYKAENVTLDSGVDANEVIIPHSTLQTVKYTYDSDKKVYKRFARNKAQTDWQSGNAITTKNIIIEMIDNYTLQDTENKGRQGLDNIGTFDGYYITNGKSIKIKCEKKSRTSQTVYKDLNGQEINVNDGNTWINICPKNAEVSIK